MKRIMVHTMNCRAHIIFPTDLPFVFKVNEFATIVTTLTLKMEVAYSSETYNMLSQPRRPQPEQSQMRNPENLQAFPYLQH